MRILASNDDGIDAPGLVTLAQAARSLSDDVWIVAPERKWTAASHQLTFDRDLVLRRTAERTFACSGAPADCVVAALGVLLADRPPDLVAAGVNDKRNVGEDLAYSGTFAIAREASFWGIPAVAWSAEGDAADAAPLDRMLAALLKTRKTWSRDGRWIAVTLPDAAPARVMTARIARDKIALACDVRENAPERIVFRLRRGRPGTSVPGDENAALAAGAVVVARHGLEGSAPVPASVLAALRDAVSAPR